MPTAVRMYVRLDELPSAEELESLRHEFMQAMSLAADDFYFEGPLMVVSESDYKYMPVKDGRSSWLGVNVWRSYFGPEYRRGNPELFVKIAEWLERKLPGAEIYYGHDVDDENISLFDQTTRENLLKLYHS